MAPQASLLALAVALGSTLLLLAPPTVSAKPLLSSRQAPTPVQDGIAADCDKWHQVKSGEGCLAIVQANEISLADFLKWNPALLVRTILFPLPSGHRADQTYLS